MVFAFIYALPGYTKPEIHTVKTDTATFIAAAVDFAHRERTPEVAKDLVENHGVEMIELCGGLANAQLVAAVKQAINDRVPVGAVYYGPESRRPLVDLLNL